MPAREVQVPEIIEANSYFWSSPVRNVYKSPRKTAGITSLAKSGSKDFWNRGRIEEFWTGTDGGSARCYSMPRKLEKCPTCKSEKLKTAFRNTISFDDSYPHFTAAQDNCLLRDVLHVDEVSRDMMFCSECGLFFISPTFTDSEMDLLYNKAKLSDHFAKVKTSKPLPSQYIDNPEIVWDMEKKHSEFIFETVRNKLPELAGKNVIDLGGRYGNNLQFFLKSGAKGYVHDLVCQEKLYPQVKFAPSLEELGRAEAIICTHVLEHVIDLEAFCESFSEAQKPGDLFYAEVPFELDVRLRRRDFDAPFHINFFSPAAMENLFRRAGYTPLQIRVRSLTYGGQPMLALFGLFQKGSSKRVKARPTGKMEEISRGIVYRGLNKVAPGTIAMRL